MSLQLESDLMLAILAMDAYNRGYNSSLDLDAIKQIGQATVSADSSDKFNEVDTRNSGFYAVQYSWDGKTVLSYRGTDNDGVFAKPDKGASDIWSGWSIGAGYANASQATWAEKFYKAVTGQEVDAAASPSASPSASRSVTGPDGRRTSRHGRPPTLFVWSHPQLGRPDAEHEREEHRVVRSEDAASRAAHDGNAYVEPERSETGAATC